MILFLKGGSGSGNHGHGGRPGQVGGSAKAPPSSSAEINSLSDAEAYWSKHFNTGSAIPIDCKYGKRRYHFAVTFQRNHAYTKDSLSVAADQYRSFDIDRAQSMDRIFEVLRNPHVVTWSKTPGNKVFDRTLNVDSQHGRVVLEPTPTPEDIAAGVVTHFLFVSWHTINRGQFDDAARQAKARHVAPTQIKKAIQQSDGLSSRTPSVVTLGQSPASEGIPFNWSPYFYGMHSRNLGSDVDAGSLSGADGTSLLSKASIPAGARWITVHPNGADSKGQPVLIQPQPDGSAHVIGGAGGKLNYLKLRAVRKESDYQKEVQAKKDAGTAAKKEQRKKDKEAGLVESKKKARDAVKEQRRQHEAAFVDTVADTLGWDKSNLAFPEDDYAHLSDAAQAKVRQKHHQEIMRRATEAVELQRQQLVNDPEARRSAGIDVIPLDANGVEQLSVQDLSPIPNTSAGLGFSTDYKERAEAAGLSGDELARETGAVKEKKEAGLTEGQKRGATTRKETVKRLKAELSDIRDPDVPVENSLVDAKKALDLLKAQKALKQVQKQAQAATKEIDKSAVEPKAYVLEYTADPDLDAKVTEDLANDLRTLQTRSFLSEVGKLAGPNATESLGGHIGVGAYNSINALALAAGGDALVDRSVVDVLGIAGAAQVLARRLSTDLSADEYAKVTEGVEDFHLNHYMDTSRDAIEQARELVSSIKEIELGEAANGSELQVAQSLNAKRRGATNQAQKILGQALGEMEANAALVLALRQGKKESVQVPMAKATAESAIRQARALGLQRGDYEVSFAGGNTFLTVSGAGMDRLAKPVSREDLAQVRRNLDIIGGGQDEDGWLPLGVARRPDLVMDVPAGVAPRLAEPFEPGGDLHQSLRDYIGGRAADGDSPADIVADIQSADFINKVGADRTDQYREALDQIAPLKDASGKPRRAEALAPDFEKLADDFVQRRHGVERAPIHRQQFAVDQHSVDALHRALSETPEGTAAYKEIGELDSSDQRALREYFHRNVAKESADAAQLRGDAEEHAKNEPERRTTDLFGEESDNPDWAMWDSRRTELAGKVNAANLNWPKYVESMRGHERAYEAVQDLVRSKVAKSFADAHNKLNPKAPIKLGKASIRNNLNHLDATDPAARQSRMDKERELIDGLRERAQGRYSAGGVTEKLDAARDRQEAFDQSQMGFFSSEELPAAKEQELGGDERHTLGHQAERQIAGMMGIIGKNFKPGQPTKLWSPTMSGGNNAPRQRLVKLLEANKRVVAGFGTGSGKSLLQLAGFTHLHSKGKVKRGLFAVPSIVQGQFSGEALRYLEPGKYNWHIEPGASQAERIAAYKDPSKHFAVMTHAAIRDDMIHLGAKKAGIDEKEMASRIGSMSPDERKGWMKELLDHEGINFDYLTVDEGQNTLNRAGKENSSLANVVDALSAHTPYYMTASADPVKNDASEIHDLLSKMDPERYKDRAAFMRRYGADTIASKNALRREMARYVYPSKIDPHVRADRRKEVIPLSAGQKESIGQLDKHFASARLARMQGKVDVAAARAISPASFDGADQAKHEDIAMDVQKNLGILKSSAIRRAIDTHPDNPTVDHIARTAKERKGKPGVVFAHSLESVKQISARLEKEGHRVVTITGADSAQEKDRKRQMFNPERGDAKADILVASDAGSTGMNIQRGQWLYQADTPQTAMTHAQRQGRIFRTGQKNDVELIDAVQDHPEIHRARDRLAKKYGLRDLMSSPMEGLDDTGVGYYIKQRQVEEQQGGLF